MAQAKASTDVVASGGSDASGNSTHAGEAYSSGGTGDEFVTASGSTLSSSSQSWKSATEGMSEKQISALIETSREQGWSELTERAHDVGGAPISPRDQDNLVHWEELKKKDPHVFRDFPDDKLKLGKLIAEGGQACIYEASLDGSDPFVAKVFKAEGFSLADLERQWPHATADLIPKSELGLVARFEAIFSQECGRGPDFVLGEFVFGEAIEGCVNARIGTLLKDNSFAFLMKRYWGDLRTFINLKLKQNNNSQGPPLPYHTALLIIICICSAMVQLHSRGVIHRDLKAANILVDIDRDGGYRGCFVADFDSANMVQGTGFWRAPEVLEDLLKRPQDRNPGIWTEKADVYSFAMTLYEVLTGHVPFYGYDKKDWKRVIDGERPHLPEYIHPSLRELVQRCWHKDPSERPTFEIIQELSLSYLVAAIAAGFSTMVDQIIEADPLTIQDSVEAFFGRRSSQVVGITPLPAPTSFRRGSRGRGGPRSRRPSLT